MQTLDDLKLKFFKDKEFKAIYDELKPEYAFIEAVIKKRLKKGYTQKQLADKMGTKQSAISRLESGNCNPSLRFLLKIAKALDTTLAISL